MTFRTFGIVYIGRVVQFTQYKIFEELKKLLLLALNTGVKALIENLIKFLFNL